MYRQILNLKYLTVPDNNIFDKKNIVSIWFLSINTKERKKKHDVLEIPEFRADSSTIFPQVSRKREHVITPRDHNSSGSAENS